MDTGFVMLLLFLVLGWASLLFATLYVIGRIIGGVGRGVASVFRPAGPVGSGRRLNPGRAGRVCPCPQCRRIEYRDAQYCSQCGAPLQETPARRRREAK